VLLLVFRVFKISAFSITDFRDYGFLIVFRVLEILAFSLPGFPFPLYIPCEQFLVLKRSSLATCRRLLIVNKE
jgi:hypothetical protein